MATNQQTTYYYEIDLYVDGSSQPNPGPSAIGIVIVDPQTGNVLEEIHGFVGSTTIVKAEYLAMIHGLDVVRKKYTCRKVSIYSDNLIAVKQTERVFRVKESTLEEYFVRLRHLADTFFKEGVEVFHISEAPAKPSFNPMHHGRADQLAKASCTNRNPKLTVKL